jgi:Dolichyl-phosphate-mannose-protein mannosyltransferase
MSTTHPGPKQLQGKVMDEVQQNGRASRLTIGQRWTVAALIIAFILFSCLADLWPVKNVYFYIYSRVDGLLTMDLELNPAMRYAAGNGIHSTESFLYVLVVKLFYLVLPYRFLCLRAVSVCSTAVALFFLYRLAVLIFSRPVSILFLFLLVTSPIYLESMRSIGFIPLTNTIVVIACYFFVRGIKSQKPIGWLALSALFGLLTLSLYLPGKLVLLIPVIFFLLFPKKYWRQLLIFLILVIVPVLAVDQVIGDIDFDAEYTLKADGEFLMYDPPIDWLTGRLRDNTQRVLGYLFQINRSHFTEARSDQLEDCQSRLLNPAYTLFFFIGLVICLRKWRELGALPLIWFALYFFGPVLSTELSPRRFILALNPLYLITAVGLWTVFVLIRDALNRPGRKRILIFSSLILLAGSGGYDLHEFFFRVAKPVYAYSREQLIEVADLLGREGSKAMAIVIEENRATALIWGNPYFDPARIDPAVFRKIIYQNSLQDQESPITLEGDGALYLFSFPSSPADFLPGEKERLDALILLSEKRQPGVTVKTVPGTGVYTVLITGDREVRLPVKADEGESVLSSKTHIPLRVSSGYSTVAGAGRMTDNRPITFWKISNRDLGEKDWVIRDFGPKVKKTITMIRALPREDHPDESFHQAHLSGGNDGLNWDLITGIEQKMPPADGEWLEWSFQNKKSYRFYKFEITSGHSGRSGTFRSLAELRLME